MITRWRPTPQLQCSAVALNCILSVMLSAIHAYSEHAFPYGVDHEKDVDGEVYFCPQE